MDIAERVDDLAGSGFLQDGAGVVASFIVNEAVVRLVRPDRVVKSIVYDVIDDAVTGLWSRRNAWEGFILGS